MDEERILLAYTPSETTTTFVSKKSGNIWQDITFDVDGLSIIKCLFLRTKMELII